MAHFDRKRRGEKLKCVVNALAKHPDGLPAKDVLSATATVEGLEAAAEFTDPEAFMAQAAAGYKAWAKTKRPRRRPEGSGVSGNAAGFGQRRAAHTPRDQVTE